MTVSIIGGGPAGAAAAIRLARAGVAVRLFEKSKGPHHKVCGEFVSGEAVTELRTLGVDVHALGGLPLREVGLASPSRRSAAVTALPFAAVSLSRRVLDEALLVEAARAGADVVRGVALRLDASELRGTTVFAATGKHDLPGHARPPGPQPDLIGFKMYYRTPRAPAPRVDLVPFTGGYVGLQPVPCDGHTLNLCLLVHRDAFAGAHGFASLVSQIRAESPYLDVMLRDAEPCWPKPLAISRLPYGFVRRATETTWWLGDQAAVIPSFAGDGIAIALHSAGRAASALLAGQTAAQYQTALAQELRGQVARATWVSRLLVRPWFQPLADLTARAAPSLVRAVAMRTRVAAA